MSAIAPSYLALLDPIVRDVVAPAALAVDRDGTFPRAALDALGQAGLLGLISSREVGGLGEGHRAAAQVVERLARECASTAMVVCMHYAATAVIERHGTPAVREAIARGEHLSTLAFSESGSRSHFWAPVSTAVLEGSGVRLDAHKSWATSAGQVQSYVWSSRPVAAEGASTIWLVPGEAPGLHIPAPFDGLGLRGNSSTALLAEGLRVDEAARLGADGGGFALMMEIVLPIFQVLTAAVAVGIMESAVARTAAHLRSTRHAHLGQSLADLPTVRAYLARMKLRLDQARLLLDDTLAALEGGRDDAMLRVLEVKAAAGEAALEVVDTAMRVCGGAAFRKEVAVERCFRDARAASVMAPTSDVLYDFLGKAVLGLPLF